MPATAARIGFITEQWRRVISGPDSGVVTRYGTLARDNSEPVETFFDAVADAQVLADERLALLSPSRRLLTSQVQDAAVGLGVVYQPTIATAQVIDDERGYAASALVTSIGFDLEADKTEFLTWG